MFDDDICSASDMRVLEQLCIAGQLVRCDKCCHAEPNAGHDVPYCIKLTKLGKGNGKREYDSELGGYIIPYRLEKGTIPKVCKYWKSERKELNKRRSEDRIAKTQSAINNLTLKEKRQLKL